MSSPAGSTERAYESLAPFYDRFTAESDYEAWADTVEPVLLRLRDITGASLLVIEHDLPLIMSVSDRIVALDVGRVVCEGSAERVVNDPQVVESYLGANWNLTGSSQLASKP